MPGPAVLSNGLRSRHALRRAGGHALHRRPSHPMISGTPYGPRTSLGIILLLKPLPPMILGPEVPRGRTG
eukprot:754207-Hanusia_phi.AAC.2